MAWHGCLAPMAGMQMAGVQTLHGPELNNFLLFDEKKILLGFT
jgi:hypothetical protein